MMYLEFCECELCVREIEKSDKFRMEKNKVSTKNQVKVCSLKSTKGNSITRGNKKELKSMIKKRTGFPLFYQRGGKLKKERIIKEMK